VSGDVRRVPVIGAVTWKVALVAVLALLSLGIPMVAGPFWTNVATSILAVGLFAMSFNLLFGYVGLLSFGHQAFFGVSAYTVAIGLTGSEIGIIPVLDSFLLAVAAGVVVATVVAALFGAMCVQRGGIFFAMLTLALGMLLYEGAIQWEALTGGDNGTTLLPPDVSIGPIAFSPLDPVPYFYFTFVVVAVSVLVMWRFVNSHFGEILVAIRENNERAAFVGINVKLYQWIAFTVSGLFAGIAGALLSVKFFNISPGVLHWSQGADAVVATLIGGPTSFMGPILGAIVFIMIEQILTGFISDGWQVVLGALLIPIVLFFPGGILGFLFGDSSMASLKRRVGSGTTDAENGDGADSAGTVDAYSREEG
jgi:branched-chain amino acid transport system permease protein